MALYAVHPANFAHLREHDEQLLRLGMLAEKYFAEDPNTCLLKLLQDNIRAEKGQLIVATHNPLMIGSLRKNQVRILTQQTQATIAEEPEYDPIGIGVEGLLKSELYGLRSSLAPEILNKIDRHYLLLGKSERTDDEQQELRQLANELNELGVARTHPNPYFEQFANAMAKHIPAPEAALTKEEIEEQANLADEVLAEILGEEYAVQESSQE